MLYKIISCIAPPPTEEEQYSYPTPILIFHSNLMLYITGNTTEPVKSKTSDGKNLFVLSYDMELWSSDIIYSHIYI